MRRLAKIAGETALGELRDVKAAGHRNFLGITGPHRFFHTPADGVATTGPEVLKPVARAFAALIRHIAAEPERAAG